MTSAMSLKPWEGPYDLWKEALQASQIPAENGEQLKGIDPAGSKFRSHQCFSLNWAMLECLEGRT